MLSISRRKAGSEVYCPRCDSLTRVPADAAEPAEEQPVAAPIETPAPSESAPSSDVDAGDDTDAADAPPPTGEFVIAAENERPNPWAEGAEEDEHPFTVRKGRFANDEMDMTSLVDVTFLLLVFFMITASFSVQKALEIGPPESEDGASSGVVMMDAEDIAEESVIIEIDDQDRLKVDDVPVTGLAELKSLLESKRATESKTDVILESAYNSTHGMNVTVTDTAIAAGMQKVRSASRSRDE
jgi:biopolymer transport protein ExbD